MNRSDVFDHLLTIFVMIMAPIVGLWALNDLFGLNLPFTVQNILGVAVLIILFGKWPK